MTLHITKTEFLDKLREVVAERGRDYVDPLALKLMACTYHNLGDGPGCIIGAVAFKLGVEYDELERWSNIGGVGKLVMFAAVSTDTEETTTLMKEAQWTQDSGWTYGAVLDEVERLAG